MKQGWETRKLGELCRFIDYRGKTPEKTTSGLRLITAKNVKMGFVQEAPMEFVTPESYDGWMTRGIPKMGDVLFTTEAPLANVAQLDTNEKVVFAQRIIVLQPLANNLDRTFLKYLLISDVAQSRILEQGTGATVQGIKASLLKTIPIEFPPLSEQQRIVGLLDEAFAGLAIAKANAEKNFQNARALFESHLQSVFTQRGKGWLEEKLGGIIEFKNGLNFTRQSRGQTLRIVGVGDFQERSIVPIEALQSVTIDGELGDDYLIRRDDILTVRSNGSRDLVGRCMLVPDVDEVTSFSGFIIRLRFDAQRISPRFLLYFMKSSGTRDRLTRDGGGANISNINQGKLSELPISLPPFKEQNDIANRLDALRKETQRLASLYERKLVALEELKKALLHQAFSGELTKEFRESVVIPFPVSAADTARLALHAGILAIGHQAHMAEKKEKYFGHVKAEKTVHLFEARLERDLGRIPVKAAAGPSDFPRLKEVEDLAEQKHWFVFKKESEDMGYRLTPLENYQTLIETTREELGDLNPRLDELIKRMLPMKKVEVEVMATVYAAWNNLLMDGEALDDERIVLESRENWHPDKLKIARARFFDAIQWLKENDMIPDGKGKRVLDKVT